MSEEAVVRYRQEQDGITFPNGMPWVDRHMPPEQVAKLHESHYCDGYDCGTCVWIATYEKLGKRLHNEQMAAGRLELHLEQLHGGCDGTEDGCPNAF